MFAGFPCLSLVNFLQCTFMAGLRNNFQDHRRLSEQFLCNGWEHYVPYRCL
jgi:hypothetical protein